MDQNSIFKRIFGKSQNFRGLQFHGEIYIWESRIDLHLFKLCCWDVLKMRFAHTRCPNIRIFKIPFKIHNWIQLFICFYRIIFRKIIISFEIPWGSRCLIIKQLIQKIQINWIREKILVDKSRGLKNTFIFKKYSGNAGSSRYQTSTD